MYQNVFDHQNNPQQNYNNSSQVFPLSPSNYAYKKESPINYTNFPSNMSPRNVYEQYSMPVAYPNEQPQFFERSPPLPILNPITKIPLPIDNQKIYIQSPRITNRNNVNQIQQKGIMRSSGHLLPAKEPKYSVMRSDSPNRKMRSSAHIIPLKDSQNTIMRSSYQYIPVEDIQRTIIKPPTNFIPVREIITSPSRILTPRNNNDELFVNLKVEIERLSFLLKEKEEELNSFKAKCLHLEAHLTVEKMPSPNNHRIQVDN